MLLFIGILHLEAFENGSAALYLPKNSKSLEAALDGEVILL